MKDITRRFVVWEAILLAGILAFAQFAVAHGGGPCADGGNGCAGVAKFDSMWRSIGFTCAAGSGCAPQDCLNGPHQAGGHIFCACHHGSGTPAEPDECHMYGITGGGGISYPACVMTGPCPGGTCHEHVSIVGVEYWESCCCN